MKKVLLATSALVAFAGAAAADVSLAGYARVAVETDGTTTSMDHRFQLGATGSVETDSGLALSVYSRLRVDDSERADGFNAPTVTMKFGTVTVQAGNTYSALTARTNPFGSGTGLNGDYGLYTNTSGWYSSTGAAGMDRVRIDLAAGDFVVSVSGDVSGDEAIAFGVSGSVAGFNVGVGMNDADAYEVDVNKSFGALKVGLKASDTVNGAYFGYTQGALGLQAYAGDNDDWGLGMTYDLGGATVGAEYNQSGAANLVVGFSF